MRTTVILAWIGLVAVVFAANGPALAAEEARASQVFAAMAFPTAVAGLAIEPSAKGPVQAAGTTLMAVAGVPIQPSAKGDVAHIELRVS